MESRYRAFMLRFWQRVAEGDGSMRVREFESICSLVYNNARLHNTDMNHPYRIISIDYRGNFATFDPELLGMPSDHYGDADFIGSVLDSFIGWVPGTDDGGSPLE